MWTLTNLGPSPKSNWNLEVLVFVEGGKPENLEKNPQSKARTNNKLNPHETASTGIELGSQRWEAAAYLLCNLCSPSKVLITRNALLAKLTLTAFLFLLGDETKVIGAFPGVPQRVLDITYHRHQSGSMMKMVYQVLTKAEVTFGTTLEDEYCTDRPPCAVLFRPIRKKVYGILFDESSRKVRPVIREWCIYGGKSLDKPDLVEPVSLIWDVPPVEKLWFNKGAAADSNRLKAFLSCMQCDTPNMTQTVMVPKRLVVLCCVLRYHLCSTCFFDFHAQLMYKF